MHDIMPGVAVEWKESRLLPMEASGVARLPDGQLLVVNDESKNNDNVLLTVGLGGDYELRCVCRFVKCYYNKFKNKDRDGTGGEEQEKKAIDGLEGIAVGGDFIYTINADGVLMRIAIFPDKDCVAKAVDLSEQLKQKVDSELKKLKKDERKLNIEGLAMDSAGNLLIGLRDPRKGSKALIIKLRVSEDLFDKKDGHELGKPIELDLGGHAIRDITKDENEGFFIVSGRGDFGKDRGKDDFGLWRWSGKDGDAPVEQDIAGIDHAEGVTVISGDRLLFVRDRSSEFKDYVGKKYAKDSPLSLPGQYAIVELKDIKPKPAN